MPAGIAKVFRSGTNTGFFAPRAFQDDTPEDKRAIQDVISLIAAYPLAEVEPEHFMRCHIPPDELRQLQNVESQ